MPRQPTVFPPRDESPDSAEEREARIDEMLATINQHQEVARHGEDSGSSPSARSRAPHSTAAQKKAEGSRNRANAADALFLTLTRPFAALRPWRA